MSIVEGQVARRHHVALPVIAVISLFSGSSGVALIAHFFYLGEYEPFIMVGLVAAISAVSGLGLLSLFDYVVSRWRARQRVEQ